MFDHALEKLRLARRRNLSLVDIASFDCIRKNGMVSTFTIQLGESIAHPPQNEDQKQKLLLLT